VGGPTLDGPVNTNLLCFRFSALEFGAPESAAVVVERQRGGSRTESPSALSLSFSFKWRENVMGRIVLSVAALGGALLIGSPASAGSNLVTNGNFSSGNTGFTTDYTLTTMTPYLFQNGVHGIYAVLPIGSLSGQSQYGDWDNVTTDPSGGNGNVFAADGATNANTTVWQESVNVTPNTNYVFSFYAAEISNPCCSNADFVPTINSASGAGWTVGGSWQQYTYAWNSGSSTSAILSLTDTNTSGPYNDFVLDDLSFSSAAPEPSTWAMMLIGFGGLGFARYRRMRKAGVIAA
jgi:hypothetical protein